MLYAMLFLLQLAIQFPIQSGVIYTAVIGSWETTSGLKFLEHALVERLNGIKNSEKYHAVEQISIDRQSRTWTENAGQSLHQACE